MKININKLAFLNWFRFFEITAVIFSFPFGIFLYYLLFKQFTPSLILIPIMFIAYFCADIFAGIVHWAGDTLGNENTPFWGKNFVQPFRLHHTNPKLMTTISLWENLGSSCILAIIVQLTLYTLLKTIKLNDSAGLLFIFLNSLFIMTALTNLFHRFAHLEAIERPKFILFLQRYHLILNPTHHQIHHTYPHSTYFCVTNGWANYILAKIKFWNILNKLKKL